MTDPEGYTFLEWSVMPSLGYWIIYQPGAQAGHGIGISTPEMAELYVKLRTRLIQAGALDPGHYVTPDASRSTYDEATRPKGAQ